MLLGKRQVNAGFTVTEVEDIGQGPESMTLHVHTHPRSKPTPLLHVANIPPGLGPDAVKDVFVDAGFTVSEVEDIGQGRQSRLFRAICQKQTNKAEMYGLRPYQISRI